jgi:hypothetical protein
MVGAAAVTADERTVVGCSTAGELPLQAAPSETDAPTAQKQSRAFGRIFGSSFDSRTGPGAPLGLSTIIDNPSVLVGNFREQRDCTEFS